MASTPALPPLPTPVRLASSLAAAPDPSAGSSRVNSAPTPVLDACEPAPSQLYCVYTVRPGDTLSTIGELFGLAASGELSPSMLLAESNRPDVIDADTIIPGQKLRIPREPGIIYTVITAEALSRVAEKYGVSVETIRSLTVNGLNGDESIPSGRELLIPEPRLVPQMAAASEEAEDSVNLATPEPARPQPTATLEPEPTATTITAAPRVPSPTRTPRPSPTPMPRSASRRGPGLIWPVEGPISSRFGPAHPLGIDIDLFTDSNEAIKAAAAGTVTFAGGDACCSYGYYVVIEHEDGFTTLYAHLARISVKEGERVRRGDTIGRGGRTGYATGYHLHFEVRRDGEVVDPMRYLP